MSSPDHAAREAAAYKALEDAAHLVNGKCERHDMVNDLLDAVDDLLAARRAAEAAGMVACMIHRTTLEMVRNAHDCYAAIAASERLWSEARDLAAVLNPEGE